MSKDNYFEVNLNFLLRSFKENIFPLIYSCIAALCLAIVFIFSVSEKYSSNTIIKVKDDPSQIQIPNLLSPAISNLSPFSQQSNKTEEVIKTIYSKEFLESFFEKYELKPYLSAYKKFDAKNMTDIFDEEIYRSNEKKWVRDEKKFYKAEPDIQEIYEDVFLDAIDVSYERNENFVELTFTHQSPLFAQSFIEKLLIELDAHFRNKDLKESSDAIAFLSEEYQKNNLDFLDNAISDLIEINLQKQVAAKINKDYLIEVIDRPLIPIKPSYPPKLLILIFSLLIPPFLFTIYFIVIGIRRSIAVDGKG